MNGAGRAPQAALRILVAIASYGTGNDHHLARLVRAYRAMPFHVDIVVLSNIAKQPAPGVECRVGLPARNPWSLPFAHKKLFVERAERYDLFVYSEDDILITQANLSAFLDVTAVLRDDEIAGFVRREEAAGGAVSYPDLHAYFHWDTASVRRRGDYVLAHLTNEHAACYALTRAQLGRAIASGGFDVPPHEGRYDLLCTAATDPYTQCGMTKVIPISHLDAFTVHHLSNKYAGLVGVDATEMRRQIGMLMQIADSGGGAPLFPTETRLWRALYSKDYDASACDDVVAAVPPGTRTVLSIGCGAGATEAALAARGMAVTALPLDPVIAGRAAARGIEIVGGDVRSALKVLRERRFDCLLLLDVLHLAPGPIALLSMVKDLAADAATIVIRSPNMRSLPAALRRLRDRPLAPRLRYAASGVHPVSRATMREWCRRAGIAVEETRGIVHRRAAFLRAAPDGLAALALSPDFVTVARKAAPARQDEAARDAGLPARMRARPSAVREPAL